MRLWMSSQKGRPAAYVGGSGPSKENNGLEFCVLIAQRPAMPDAPLRAAGVNRCSELTELC